MRVRPLTKPELVLRTLSQLPALSMPVVVSNPMPPGHVSLLGIFVPYFTSVAQTDEFVCERGINARLKVGFSS